MDSISSSEIAIDFAPMLRIYKDGRVERLMGIQIVPAGFDPGSGVHSKDIVFSPETGVSARLYRPNNSSSADPSHKLPILVYFHGGGFVIETASSPTYHNYLNTLAAHSQIVVVSVDYRRAPEHALPFAYDDSWAALKWVASHAAYEGPEQWLNDYADFTRVFLAGDSAGANIAHHVGLRAGAEEIGGGVHVKGVILVHPLFWGEEPVDGEPNEPEKRAMAAGLWRLVYPATIGADDPWLNPEKDPKLKSMGCEKMLVCVAGKDVLKHRGRHYKETMGKIGCVRSVEIMEAEDEHHVFHLLGHPNAQNAVALLDRMSFFMNRD